MLTQVGAPANRARGRHGEVVRVLRRAAGRIGHHLVLQPFIDSFEQAAGGRRQPQMAINP